MRLIMEFDEEKKDDRNYVLEKVKEKEDKK